MRSPSTPGTVTLPRHKGPWHKFRVLGLSPTGHRNFPAPRQNKSQPAREAESCSDPQGSSTLLQTHLSSSNSRPSLNPQPKLSPSELGPGPGKAGYPGTHGNFLFCCSNKLLSPSPSVPTLLQSWPSNRFSPTWLLRESSLFLGDPGQHQAIAEPAPVP